MPVTVAMYDRSFQYVGACLDALGLDIFVHPFDRDGKCHVNGTRIVNSSAQGVDIAEYVRAWVLALVHPTDPQRDQQARRHRELTPFRELSQKRAA